MNIRRIEQIEKDDPSEETQNLTYRKELVKPGEYRTSNGAWKKYNPPRRHRAEINQKKRLLWDRMEEQDEEPEGGTIRRKELQQK